MKNEDKLFIESCSVFKEYATIDEYIQDIQRCLELSSWNYSAETVKKLIDGDMDFIRKSFDNKVPADDVAVDVGYFCG